MRRALCVGAATNTLRYARNARWPLKNLYCWDPHHREPCPMPCNACVAECPPEAWADSPENRILTSQWRNKKTAQWLAKQKEAVSA